MKMRCVVLCFCILYGGCVFADDFSKYMMYTNYAELAIVRNDYKAAEKYYDTAFNSWRKPFAVDIYNDLRCANLDSQYGVVAALAKRLVLLGCPISFFDKPDYLEDFRTSLAYYSLLCQYEEFRLKYLKNNNWRLRAKIEDMRAKDEVIRRQSQFYTVMRDSVYQLDDTTKNELHKIFVHGFPNEYDYGIFLKDDTSLAEYEPLHLPILHNYGKFDTTEVINTNRRTDDFTPILLTAVKKGQMHPQEFAYLNGRSGAFMIGKGYHQEAGLLVYLNGKYYYNNYSYSAEVVNNRKALNLDTYHDEEKKAMFNFKNGNKFIFFRHMGYILRMQGAEFPDSVIKYMFKEAE